MLHQFPNEFTIVPTLTQFKDLRSRQFRFSPEMYPALFCLSNAVQLAFGTKFSFELRDCA